MTRNIIDTYANGSTNTKTSHKALDLIEIMASNCYQVLVEKGQVKKEVYELDTLNTLLANNETLQQQPVNLTKYLENMHKKPVALIHTPIACDFCVSDHSNEYCEESSPSFE